MKAFVEEDPRLEGIYWVQDAGACSGVYVLENGRTLVDAGNMYGLVDELADLGPLSQIERILLTHSHFDHVGGVQEIYQLTAPDLYVHPMAREYLRLHRPPFPAFFEALERDGKIRFIHEGDWIEGNPRLRVIHTPGHTAGDVCFLDERSGALFAGDVLLPHNYKLGTVLSKPDPVCGGRMQDKIESLRKLLRYPVHHLFAGHGEPMLHNGGDQLKIALYSLYQSFHEGHSELAWVAVGRDLLEVGLSSEARQCAAKARDINPECADLKDFEKRLAEAGHGQE